MFKKIKLLVNSPNLAVIGYFCFMCPELLVSIFGKHSALTCFMQLTKCNNTNFLHRSNQKASFFSKGEIFYRIIKLTPALNCLIRKKYSIGKRRDLGVKGCLDRTISLPPTTLRFCVPI